jgi:hypothetical protein
VSLFPKFKLDVDPLATSATSATPPQKSRESRESRNPPRGEIDYRVLYAEAAAAVHEDCFLLDPDWLLAHPDFYEQIRVLDDKLTTMERVGGSEQAYRATLARLVQCIQDARAAYEREQSARSAVQ